MAQAHVTKWALTKGILEVQTNDEARGAMEGTYLHVRGSMAGHTVGKDLFFTLAAAEAEARDMATRKIRALETTIKVMESLAATPRMAPPRRKK